MISGTATLIGIILAGIASAVGNIWSSYNQKAAQEEANKANLEQTRLANEAQLQQVREANQFNSAEAQKNRDWQEYMSNTQVQRAMADYSAAGLNPILALPGGASYGSGATAQANVAQVKAGQVAPASLDLSGISTAIQSMTNLMLISSIVNKNKAQLLNISSQDDLNRQLWAFREAGTAKAVFNKGYGSIRY